MISIPMIGAIASAVRSAIGDPYISSVAILLHGESIIDSSPTPVSLTNLDTSISNSIYKFGSGSLYFNGSSKLTSATYSQLNLSGGDFTIEFFIYPTSVSNAPQVLEVYSSGPIRIPVGINTDGTVWFTILNGTGNQYTQSTIQLTLNQWSHIAAVVYSGKMYLYINGISSVPTNITYMVLSASYSVNIGYYRDGNSNFLNGYIDEFRITKGTARYTSNFTPPTSQFPDS